MRRSLIILVVLFITVCVGAGAIWFGYGYLLALKEDKIRLVKEVTQMNYRIERLKSLKSTYDRALAEQEKLNSYFLRANEEDWIRFATEMVEIARLSGASVETSIGELSKDAKSFTEEFKYTGTWDEVYRLLRLAETYPARMRVISFTAGLEGSARDAKPTGTWRGSIVVEAASVRSVKP
jgi:hypothetical protein